MAKHKIKFNLLVTFDDGTQRYLKIPERVFYYHEQKFLYWVDWIEELIEEEKIAAKPIRIEEVYKVVEVDEYELRIGV